MNELTIGSWNVICDVCGFKKKANAVRKRWDGLMVCPEDWETRHPQDFIRPVKEDTSVPFVRSESADTFVDVDYVASSVGVQDNTVPSGTFNTTDTIGE